MSGLQDCPICYGKEYILVDGHPEDCPNPKCYQGFLLPPSTPPDRPEPTPQKFRSKPRIIEAEQFWPDKPLPFSPLPYVCFVEGAFCVCTAHGQYVLLAPGDWVIPEPTGPALHRPFSAYPVKPDIFAATYEPVAVPDAGAPQKRKRFDDLRAEMSPESQRRSAEQAAVMLENIAPARAHQERTERPRDHYTWGEAMEQFAALGIGAEAWAELMELEQRGTKARNNDRSGMSISWRTFRVVLAVLRAIRIEDFINARTASIPAAPARAHQEEKDENDDVSRVDGECLSQRQELPRKSRTGCP